MVSGELINPDSHSRHAKLLRAPAIMGILNVTPDSFSDGGAYASEDAAVEAALSMCAAGAEIIDVGGESTRPGFSEVDVEEEKARTVGVVARLAEKGLLVSIDTRHAAVAEAALSAGAQIINDVEGFRDSEMVELAARTGCGCIVVSDASDATSIAAFWEQQAKTLLEAEVKAENIIVDPGFGFGKQADQNIQVMQALPDLIARSGFPVLVGVSRKRFIGGMSGVSDPRERDAATLGVDLYAAEAGAAILRVHNVEETFSALSTFWPITHPKAHRALIALGSEVGAERKDSSKEKPAFNPEDFKDKTFDEIQYARPLEFMRSALAKIAVLPMTEVKKASAPVVSQGALGVEGPVVNAVIEIETSLLPHALLQNMLHIEDELGRRRPNPRTIDIDLLWIEGYEIKTPSLTLPHPGMGKRHFVLRPLVEVIGPPCHFLKDIGVELAPKEERIGPILQRLNAPLL